MNLLNYAFKILARRAHGKKELKRKLLKRASLEETNTVLERLEELGYLDDEDFAYRRALERRTRRHWGGCRIARDLKRLGVSARIIDLTLSKLDREAPEAEALERAVAGWIRRSGDPAGIAELKRLFDYCSRLGFPPEEIRRVLGPRFKAVDWDMK